MASDSTTGLDAVELQELKDTFALFDVEKKGRVDPKVVKLSLLNCSGQLQNADLYYYISELDKFGDTELTFNDYARIMAASSITEAITGGEISQQQARRLFSYIDREKRGRINFRQLRDVAVDLGEPFTAEDLQEMIHRADSNGDGEVTFEDFFRIVSRKVI